MRSDDLSRAAHSLVTYALSKHLESVSYLGMVVTGHARKNDRHPEYARIELMFPDEWLKNAKGIEAFRDTYLIVKINREVTDEWSEMCSALKQKREAESLGSSNSPNQLTSSSEEPSPATAGHSSLSRETVTP